MPLEVGVNASGSDCDPDVTAMGESTGEDERFFVSYDAQDRPAALTAYTSGGGGNNGDVLVFDGDGGSGETGASRLASTHDFALAPFDTRDGSDTGGGGTRLCAIWICHGDGQNGPDDHPALPSAPPPPTSPCKSGEAGFGGQCSGGNGGPGPSGPPPVDSCPPGYARVKGACIPTYHPLSILPWVETGVTVVEVCISGVASAAGAPAQICFAIATSGAPLPGPFVFGNDPAPEKPNYPPGVDDTVCQQLHDDYHNTCDMPRSCKARALRGLTGAARCAEISKRLQINFECIAKRQNFINVCDGPRNDVGAPNALNMHINALGPIIDNFYTCATEFLYSNCKGQIPTLPWYWTSPPRPQNGPVPGPDDDDDGDSGYED